MCVTGHRSRRRRSAVGSTWTSRDSTLRLRPPIERNETNILDLSGPALDSRAVSVVTEYMWLQSLLSAVACVRLLIAASRVRYRCRVISAMRIEQTAPRTQHAAETITEST